MSDAPYYTDESVTLYHGDCLDVLADMPAASVDAIVTDPPYNLSFMGKSWDDLGKEYQDWCRLRARECLRVLKPGGHMLAFGGTRTWHRLAVAVEDAGFEIRDSIAWLYGSGFPKSLDVSKAIDKAARGVPQGGADPTSANHGKYRTTTTEGKRWEGDSGQGYGAGGSRFLVDGAESGSGTAPAACGAAAIAPDAERWQGWGTALKPAFEPIVVARKPLVGTVAGNVLVHGTGALNIDACRIEPAPGDYAHPGNENRAQTTTAYGTFDREGRQAPPHDAGRWPANAALDESQATELDQQSGYTVTPSAVTRGASKSGREGATARSGGAMERRENVPCHGDSGGASRFFPTFRYEAKAPGHERPVDDDGTAHPTVKPLDLIRWLTRLVTPSGGLVLDPFLGSGTTAEACIIEGFRCVGVEQDEASLRRTMKRLSKPIEIVLDFGEVS